MVSEQNSGNAPRLEIDLKRKQVIKKAFRQTLRMATRRLGATWPNPPTGCAILDKEGNIISLAAHGTAGEAHAEILALETLNHWDLKDKAATLVVTLEPCNHHGKTPPCVEAILQTRIPEIWIGAADPNKIATGGADRLEKAGRKVVRLWELKDPFFHDLAQDCQALITPFSTRISTNRPWIIAKQALNDEGSMIPPKGQKTFTSKLGLEIAHLLRRSCGGIITGRGTILADHPLFTIRHISDFSQTPERWIIACGQQSLPMNWIEKRKRAGFHFLHVQSPEEAVEALGKAGVAMALIEAGPKLLNAFKEAGLIDELLKIHKRDEFDYLEWEKFNSSPSPLLLLEKYSADWPKHLPLKNKKALTISPEVFRTTFFGKMENEADDLFSTCKKFVGKLVGKR
ncbi:bifunctional diaminohydroxyphosphoribosylaminopyrimidine deaminase/5-amino-6-(5-phosphoribosylamino)uracil reductase RibD [Acetobacteraceae bacterium]|nr:bifunctional diaminohydroxyphosphoribosylaminopyrimidine deaminase/5-amino-6-(5-phosphoribosylamino)uracil reductase RibD [Acetobacteraceae bacterium]